MDKTFIIDTSVILAFYLPQESYKEQALRLLKDYIMGKRNLVISSLTWYEVLNAISCLLRGLKGKVTISLEQAREIITAINLLDLEKKDIYGIEDRILELTKKYSLSAYDASYLAIAEKFNLYLITGDERFYNSVKKDFSFIKFIKDWQEEEVG